MEHANLLRILFVEDLPSDAILAERVIRKSGLEFSSQRVDTKDEFLKALEGFRPDIIVSDYSMPEFDGMRALILSLEHDAGIPFILLTGSMNEETAVACMKAGATDYVIKEHMTRLPYAVRDALKQKGIRLAKNEAEHALRESEEKYRTLVEKANEAVVVVQDGLVKFINRSTMELTGYSEQELTEKPFPQFVHPDDRNEVVENYAKRIKGEAAPPRYTFRVLTLEGNARWVESASAITTWKGKPATLNLLTDITERKLAEEKVALLAHTLKSISECVSITDLNDKVLFVNSAFLNTYGYAENEILRKDIKIVRSPHHPLETLPGINAATQEGGWHGELLNRTRDGHDFPVSLSTSFVRDDSGKVIALVGVATDITERQKAEESRQLLTTAIESSATGVVITDLEGSIVWVNKALTKMTGYSRTEVIGQNPRFLKSGKQDDSFYKNLWKTILAGNVWTGELINQRKDGSLYTEEMSITPVRTQNNKITHFVALKQDITDRKKAELNLRLSEERFRSVWDNSADGMRLTDREGRIIDVNAAFCRLVRKSREELLGDVFSVAYQSQGPDDDLTEYHRRFDAGETISDLFGSATLWNGESIALHISSSFIETSGQERLLLALFRDVTDQKKAENRLEEERTLLRTLIDAIPDEIGVKDKERRFLTVNTGTVKAFKLARPEEIIGKRDEDFVPEHLAAIAREEEEIILAEGGKMISRIAEKIDPLTGEIQRSLLVSKIPLKDSAGKTIGLVVVNRDITELQRANASLEKERKLLLTLIESIPDEVCLKDTAHRFIVVNTSIVRAIGARSIQDLLGKTDFDFMTAELTQAHFDEEDAVLASGQPIINDERTTLNPTTGEIEKCQLTTKVPVRDSTGKNVGILVINRRNTEHKRAEEELRTSEERLRILFEYAPDAYYLIDLNGNFIDGNKAAEELVGSAKADIIGKNFFTLGLLTQEDMPKASGSLGKNSRGLPSGPDEFTLNRKDGSKVEVEIRTYPVTIKNEVLVLGIGRDVSQRKRSEEALRASEETFRALFEESKDPVYFSTPNGRLLDINPAGIELLGYDSKEDLLRIDLTRDSYADANEKKRFDRQMRADGFVRNFEVTLKRKDGKKLTVLETAVAVRDKAGKIVQYRGSMRDVTRQRQLEAQFLQAQKMESIGTLAGGIAHDFNNILGIILGHVALMERSRKNDTQFEESSFSINKAVERGASLVRQILTFARKAETQLEPVNINSTIKELSKMLEETFPKTIEITQKLDKTIPIVSMDPTQLHQTLLNLCVNARDAMNGEGTLAITTHLELGRDVSSRFPKANAQHYIHVTVKDTGTGMSEETRQHLFEPFFTTKEKGKGTGLGLAVVYGVLQSHHGFIDVESAPGAGTTFHLFFPVPEGILTTGAKQKEVHEKLPRGTETILVVEDEDVLRDLLVKMLEMQGYKVIPASDGDEAVMRFSERAKEIDLVLSDMGLPKRSGWEAFRMMRKLNPKIRALLASGYIEPGEKSEILKSGVVRFLHKPYTMEEVLGAIRETLDYKKSSR